MYNIMYIRLHVAVLQFSSFQFICFRLNLRILLKASSIFLHYYLLNKSLDDGMEGIRWIDGIRLIYVTLITSNPDIKWSLLLTEIDAKAPLELI